MTISVVLISDTHNEPMGVTIPDGDILIHAGDLTQKGELDEIRRFSAWFSQLPHRHKFFIAGNHDFGFEKNPTAARAAVAASGGIYLCDTAHSVLGLRLWGSPWQPWFHSYAFNVQRGAAIKEKWDLIPSDTDILITHGPPHAILDRTYSGERVGCEELMQAVMRVKPALHVFGHIHEAYGTTIKTWGDQGQTLFANASTCNLRYRAVQAPLVVRLEQDGQGRWRTACE